jgi:transposase
MTERHDKPTYEELEAELAAAGKKITTADKKIAALEKQISKLLKRISELERAPKRQAAPFSKGPPKKKPKKPGRKKGKSPWFSRAVPEHVDETLEATLPSCCPDCGAELEPVREADQYQTDLPPIQPVTRRFRIAIGRCTGCGKRVQGRHPLQASDALGAASVQLGPKVLALGSVLNKGFGLSWEKAASFISRAFGITGERSTYCRAAVDRLGPRAEPTYKALVDRIRQAPAVGADETGWKVGGERAWLWVFATREATVYDIAAGRGWEVASRTLGSDFDGLLCRDGWAPYRKFQSATHQSCLAHHFARAADILKVARRGAARFAHGILRTLKATLDLRDKREEYTAHGFAVWRGRLEAKLDRYLAWQPSYLLNAKFVRHLRRERPHLFTFLYHPEVDATNWRAEQAIRPAVITRKMSGGNRTQRGARVQAVLTSVIRTCSQQGVDAWASLIRLLHGEAGDLKLLPEPG